MSTITRHPTLAEAALRPDLKKSIVLVLLGTALLTVSAKIQVPFIPVPMTMQTLAVLFLGFALGPRLGSITLLAYLAQGALGLPVFAGTPEKGIGLAYMVGPTGGYLLGFFVAAVLCGLAAERGWDRDPLRAGAAALAGLFAIYLFGVLWLGVVLGWDNPLLAWGLWPFLPGEALKLAILAALLPIVWRTAK